MARRTETIIFLVFAVMAAVPYLLTLLGTPIPEDQNAHRKLLELQAEMNNYLSQQRILSNSQQDFTTALSHFDHRIGDKESLLSAAASCPQIRETSNLEQEEERLRQLTDEVTRLSQALKSSLQMIQDLERQLSELEEDLVKGDSLRATGIERRVTDSVLDQMNSQIEKYCSSLSLTLMAEPAAEAEDGVPASRSGSSLDRSQVVDLVARLSAILQEKILKTHPSTERSLLSTEVFEFPTVAIAEIILNLTSATYRYPQSGLIDGQILPAIGYAPNFSIGGPEEAISNSTSLGHCWAMEVWCPPSLPPEPSSERP
jgi:hypothetical protein